MLSALILQSEKRTVPSHIGRPDYADHPKGIIYYDQSGFFYVVMVFVVRPIKSGGLEGLAPNNLLRNFLIL